MDVRLATKRVRFVIKMPPEVDIMERDAGICYVWHEGDRIEVLAMRLRGEPEQQDLDGPLLDIVEEIAQGHWITEGRLTK